MANMKPMPNRLQPPAFSPFLYRYRNLVKRFFNELKHYRPSPPAMTGVPQLPRRHVAWGSALTDYGTQNGLYLFQHWSGIVAPLRMFDPGRQVLPSDDQCNLTHGCDHSVGLLQLLRAIAILLQHLLQAAHLAFDTA